MKSGLTVQVSELYTRYRTNRVSPRASESRYDCLRLTKHLAYRDDCHGRVIAITMVKLRRPIEHGNNDQALDRTWAGPTHEIM